MLVFGGAHVNAIEWWPKMSAKDVDRKVLQVLSPTLATQMPYRVCLGSEGEKKQNPPVLDHLDNKITYHISQYSYL